METYSSHQTLHWTKASQISNDQYLIEEEPLSIRLQGKPYSVIMRTPGEEIEHVAGFCLTEGIVDTTDDIQSIAFCDGSDTNVVTVTLTPERRNQIGDHLDRREFISQSSCGLCGKEVVQELYQTIQPIASQASIDIGKAKTCLDQLHRYQPLRDRTRACHAAAIFNSRFEPISVAEDVGRHNALDKAIGKLFLKDQLDQTAFVVLSSRVSYELVQKSARAGIPVILAVSRPTALAVNLATSMNMAIACLAAKNGMFVYCGEHRLIL